MGDVASREKVEEVRGPLNRLCSALLPRHFTTKSLRRQAESFPLILDSVHLRILLSASITNHWDQLLDMFVSD